MTRRRDGQRNSKLLVIFVFESLFAKGDTDILSIAGSLRGFGLLSRRVVGVVDVAWIIDSHSESRASQTPPKNVGVPGVEVGAR